MACSKDDASDSGKTDLIVGTWNPSGRGTIYSDGASQFYGHKYFCTTQGNYSFKKDGSFRVETFDGTENDCFSTGVTTGTWENQGESYHFKIITDTSDTSDEGNGANITIQFPDSDTMRWIFENDSEEVDYSFEEYVRVEE